MRYDHSSASWMLVALMGTTAGCLESSAPTETSASTSGKGGSGTHGSSSSTAQGGGGAAPYCGDGNIDLGEDCDGAELAGKTCVDLGFDKGALGCSATCKFDTSGCCKDECTGPSGTHECASANSVHTCGQFDSDQCLEWSDPQSCPATCDQGECVCTSDADCTMQQDQCHVSPGTCVGGKCSYAEKAAGTPCDDGNKCTQTDTCQNGACIGADHITCAPLDQCHAAGVCNPLSGVCSNPNAPNGTGCDDGNACTMKDSCQNGTCVGASPVTCAAVDQCHLAGTCDPVTGQCSNPPSPNGTVCADGDACTQADTCQSGACVGASPVVCAVQDQCHVAGACNPATGQCTNPNAINGTVCNDGNACTQTDTCQNGACVGASPVVCAPQDQCHVAGACNPATGQCTNPNAINGTGCNDGNACTQTDTCQNGACVGASPVVCAPQDQCHVAGACNPATGQCTNPSAPAGTACNDGNACTQNDVCNGAGICAGTAIQCNNPSGECINPAGVCSGGVCQYTPKANGTPCSVGLCQNGSCVCAPSCVNKCGGVSDGCGGFCNSPCCGNGTIDPGEQCDGSNLNGRSCSSLGVGYTGGTLSCNAGSCTYNTALCCTANCSGKCGGVSDGCGGYCSASCCGNGVINSGEQCDGGNLNGGTCVSLGYSGGTLACTGSCTFNTSGCCAATVSWNPSSTSGTATTGLQYASGNPVTVNAGIRVEIVEVGTGVDLQIRACKTDGSAFLNSVYLRFEDWYTYSGLQMFVGTLSNNGTSCTNYGQMNSETSFSINQGLGGEWMLVSPDTSQAQWGWGCNKNVSSPSGSCWFGNTGVVYRTCR